MLFCFNPLVLFFSLVTISFCPSLSFNFKSLFLLFLVHFLKSPSKGTYFSFLFIYFCLLHFNLLENQWFTLDCLVSYFARLISRMSIQASAEDRIKACVRCVLKTYDYCFLIPSLFLSNACAANIVLVCTVGFCP